MPIYAYRCQSCGADAEYIQKFSDPPMQTCESCGGSLERAVTAAAFHLKGGGWYKDGYASTKADGGKSDGAADSKPADSASKPAGDSGASSTPTASPAPKAAAE